MIDEFEVTDRAGDTARFVADIDKGGFVLGVENSAGDEILVEFSDMDRRRLMDWFETNYGDFS